MNNSEQVETGDEIQPNFTSELEAVQTQAKHPIHHQELVPDLRSLGRNRDGFATEIGSSDADKIKQAIEAAQRKPIKEDTTVKKTKKRPVVHTIAGYRVSQPLPDDARIGWTAFSDKINPGGSLGITATEKKKTALTQELESLFNILASPWNESWQDFGIIFIIGVGAWLFVQIGAGGVGSFLCILLFIGNFVILYIDFFFFFY
jgi:hypothetical protein